MMDLDKMITCAAREIAMRKAVYSARVAAKKMSQAKADAETATMNDILLFLVKAKGCLDYRSVYPNEASVVDRLLVDVPTETKG